MLIKKSLSWEYISSTYHLVFPGYYDSAAPWKSIQECFVSKKTLSAVLQAVEEEKRISGPPTFEGEQVILSVGERMIVLQPETIRHERRMLSLYRLRCHQLGIHSFFNFSASNDDRLFSFNDIYNAVLAGARDGFEAALAGKKTIGGLSLTEYAWAYTERQPGS
ncbi:MAG TPA: hypothetical protein VHE34_21010 [Puia sp.]|uniref:hypothetical protein n=1 Tax=Puia sp. TaxID=2045100 RepID=UPI002C3F209A|nr:hypothetical protein [Puia sp.]HVU97723.1 hypothetical protein [Puia sp.]